MRFVPIFCSAFLLLAPLPACATCEVELVMAMDVSRSVDAAEFRLIRDGTAKAFANPEILELIDWMPDGVLVTVTQWSGAAQQKQIIPWRMLNDKVSTLAFAKELSEMRRAYRYELTAPAEALAHAESLGNTAPEVCRRRVIDIAGDGIRNSGGRTAEIANRIEKLGVTINGLVVRGDTPDPLEFYKAEVKRGPLAFVEVAHGYEDYPRAIFMKLLREMSPNLSLLQTPNSDLQPL